MIKSSKGADITETNIKGKVAAILLNPVALKSAATPRARSFRANSFKGSSQGSRYRQRSSTFSGGNHSKASSSSPNENVFGFDADAEATKYSLELIEGPAYLKKKVLPPVLEAIHQLMYLIKFGTIVPDPIQFIAMKLKPNMSTMKAKPGKLIDPEPIQERHQIKNEIAERFGDIVGKGLRNQDDIPFEGFSEKEIKIKELFNGEFY